MENQENNTIDQTVEQKASVEEPAVESVSEAQTVPAVESAPVAVPATTPIEPPKQTSGLAIAGLVLGIIGILGSVVPLLNLLSMPLTIVGLALAIAGFVVTNRGTRGGKGIAIAGIVLGALSLVIILVMYGGAAGSASRTATPAKSTAATASASAPAASASASSAAKQSSAATSKKYEVTIDDARTAEDYKGNPVIIVRFSWTNNSDKATSFAVAAFPKCFQNGVQLDTGIVVNDIDSDGYLADVKPGYGTSLEMAYSLKDDSPVTVEVGPLVNTKGEVWAEATFDVA